jgi:hypothetical protein
MTTLVSRLVVISLIWKQTGRMSSIGLAGETSVFPGGAFPPSLPSKLFENVHTHEIDLTFLCRLFGLREDYAEILHLCRNCRCLFWKTYGHPCIVDHQQTDNKSDEPSSCDPEAFYVPVPPQAFLKFFSL